MKAYHDSGSKFDRLRRQAEELIQQRKDFDGAPPADMLALIHELKIHQIELKIQNEELKRAQTELSNLNKKYAELYEFAPCGYLNLNPKGVVARINLAGVKLLGYSRTSILRNGFGHYIAAGHQSLYYRALSNATETGEKQCLELQLITNGGAASWVWAEIETEIDKKNDVRQWRMTLADISKKKEAEAALLVSEERYRHLFSAMVSAAVMFEIAEKDNLGAVQDIRFIEVNAAFEKLTGLGRDQVVGKTIRQFCPDTEQYWFDQVDIALREGQSEVEGFHRPLNKHFLFSVFRLDDRRLGATLSDISARVAMEKALKTRVRESTTEAQNANTALKVVLKQNVQGQKKFEEKIVSNLNEMTRMHLDRLSASNLSHRQRTLLDAVNESLDSIASPLSRRFMLENMRFTPTESRIAGLIRRGKSSKDIAQILGVATSTVDFHRNNIRRKLKLSRNTNLQSYLNSLE